MTQARQEPAQEGETNWLCGDRTVKSSGLLQRTLGWYGWNRKVKNALYYPFPTAQIIGNRSWPGQYFPKGNEFIFPWNDRWSSRYQKLPAIVSWKVLSDVWLALISDRGLAAAPLKCTVQSV